MKVQVSLDIMHESIPGGAGIVIVAKDPGDLTNGCPESHPQILRQQNLVSGTHVGALVVYFAPSRSRWRKNYCQNKRKL